MCILVDMSPDMDEFPSICDICRVSCTCKDNESADGCVGGDVDDGTL